ncbi:ABC transporter permease [Limibaculum sp. M0105]|uniref:ABC transporter permease n=1 Tax=Thermohalobaculum xanthum TaxID=2753746 RepID=A0A8J7S9T3_9RHOB|nr:ABC transporter permease [Thermohalobaculum xanthum]MBK0397907.1 ABC transporter permease [Thermohalobaculum xanthum]
MEAPAPAVTAPAPKRGLFEFSPLNRRRLRNFRANRRALWSLRLFGLLFLLSLCAELIANDRPVLVSFRGEIISPLLNTYPETFFGGDFETAADYSDPVVRCLIRTGGNIDGCLDESDGLGPAQTVEGESAGWVLRPLIPFSYATVDYEVATAPSPPDARHWLGTDDQARDVLARVIYGFRLSVLFGFGVTALSAMIGVLAGAAQGFFGGWVDLTFQRIEEVWSSMNTLYVILIISSVLAPNMWVMFFIFVAFGWTQIIGVVRAEFLRARNFEYVRAARALGVGDWRIMVRHLLPNAMVATVTLLPFMLTASIGLLAGLDFLGFGLGQGYPSLGELALQGKKYLQDPHLAITAFLTFAIMLSLMVFVFEGIRDAFDPRKTFR